MFGSKLEALAISDLVIVVVAYLASLLTLVSGFGLGTILLPAFALFFPLEAAILMTAAVHLLNNLFKTGLLWRHMDLGIVLRFGVPGILGAWLGAGLMTDLGSTGAIYAGLRKDVDLLAILIAVSMIFFALLELLPAVERWALPPKYLVPGGLLSGFFGGLSGHQGALRSIFLLRAGLSKETFIGTGIAIALLVDLTRIPIYFTRIPLASFREDLPIVCLATIAAFLGAWSGKRLIPKITFRGVQWAVGLVMLAIAGGLLAGLI